jgi:hypothetical protein
MWCLGARGYGTSGVLFIGNCQKRYISDMDMEFHYDHDPRNAVNDSNGSSAYVFHR